MHQELLNNIFIHIDTMYCVKDMIKDINVEMIYWSISEKMIKLIDETKRDKTIPVICLIKSMTYARNTFLNEIRETYQIQGGGNFAWEEVVRMNKQSSVCLGISLPAIEPYVERSNKGFRDWMAPFCDCVLIYDDIQEIVDIGSDIVPIYNYKDAKGAKALIQDLLDHPSLAKKLINKQKAWAIENTMDNQLVKIFNKYRR